MMNYDDKFFGMLSTTTGGPTTTLFHYHQSGDVVWGTFALGRVRMGAFVARVNVDDVLDLHYAFVTTDSALLTGVSLSRPEVLGDGRIRLHEEFWFTSGIEMTGVSVVEEIADHAARDGWDDDAGEGLYHNRRFISVTNTPNGEVTGDTTFHYRQRGDVVWATYDGGAIRKGTLVAVVDADGALDMRYQHVNTKGEVMTGECKSVPEVLVDGRVRLREAWRWTSGDLSKGESIVEEIR